jgi:proteic killer suppression protein
MDITFGDNKLLKCANDHKHAQKKLGALRAEKFEKRLKELRAATALEDVRNLPQARYHELTNRDRQLACNLDHPYRLIFQPAHDPVPCNTDGGLNWSQVTAVEILAIEDYH